jgi:chitinase
VSVAARKKPVPPLDVTPPTTPVISATDVGRRHISLAWTSTDEGSAGAPIYFNSTVNGGPDPYGFTWDHSRTYYALRPATTYTFTVRAKDYAGNWSATSAPFSVTTTALDPGDTQPPSAPTNVAAYDFQSGDREFQLIWAASTDNSDAQADLIYEVYLNGGLSDVVAGRTQSTNYGVSGTNTITVIAIDSNGNRSEAGTTTITFNF